jgi:dGTPase
MFETIYRGSVCQAERSRAMFVIEHLYDYYNKFPEKMSPLFLQIAAEEGKERAVVDYISGMSDAYCISLFKDIYIPQSLVPEAGRVFETKDDPVTW